MVFWLVLILSTSATLHVGNFPTLETCTAAARQAGTIRVNQGGPPLFGVSFVCVQANTGHSDDPAAPPF
jgi:hypothetical protein